jgi:hypothetical protein
LKLLSSEMEVARRQFKATGLPTRVFGEKRYQTLDSWSCERRLVGKAEHLAAGANPRFVVTSLGQEQYDARALYAEMEKDEWVATTERRSSLRGRKPETPLVAI